MILPIVCVLWLLIQAMFSCIVPRLFIFYHSLLSLHILFLLQVPNIIQQIIFLRINIYLVRQNGSSHARKVLMTLNKHKVKQLLLWRIHHYVGIFVKNLAVGGGRWWCKKILPFFIVLSKKENLKNKKTVRDILKTSLNVVFNVIITSLGR